ncbi:MAG: hypothetical protein KatS3mg076_0407 [Candidatus Binatia bacterium]|nr:MAG: hypothetical protein KatS3mg076_0407 [Candidatus Binatia bacterium]
MDTREESRSEELLRALARARLYEWLARSFERPSPEEEPIAGGFLRWAAREVEGTGGGPLLSALEAVFASPPEDPAELRAEYDRLFGHTVRGVVSPYETEYGAGTLFQQPHELGDIAGFYRAFGLALAAGVHERVDHVACECEFFAFLCRKEAFALETGNTPMLEATVRAQRLFLKDHLGRFVPAFARSLSRAAPGSRYARIAAALKELVVSDSRRLRVPFGSEAMALRKEAGDEKIRACCEPAGEPN